MCVEVIIETYWEKMQTTSPSVKSKGRLPAKIQAVSLYCTCQEAVSDQVPLVISLSLIL